MSFKNLEPSARRASNEAARLLALRNLQLLDTDHEQAFDDIVNVASAVCSAPVALVSLVDYDRQWFKARVGMDCDQTGRDVSFCSLAIDQSEPVFEIADTREDDRFKGNALVTGPSGYRFYAGVLLIVHGAAIGTLCVLDVVPRTLSPKQRESLVALARSAVMTIEYRAATNALAQADRNVARVDRDAAVFAAAIAHARDGILILGQDEATGESTRVTYVNSAFSKMFGRDFSKMVGRSIHEIAAQPANQAAIDEVFEAASGGGSQVIPLTVRLVDGSLLELEMTVSALPEQSPDARSVVVLRDLSERRSNEDAAVQRSDDRWRELFSRTPAITYTLDRDLRFRSSIGGGLSAIGLVPGQVDGMRLQDLFDEPGGFARAAAAHTRALAGESLTFEHDVLGRKFKVYLEPQRTGEREIDGVAGLAFDVTDIVAKTHALAESEAHVARAERTAQTGSWLHDLATNRLTYSEESQRMFAIGSDESDREAFYRRIVPEDRERVRGQARAAYETSVASTFEFRIVIDEKVRFIRESIEVTHDALGRPTRADGIFVDITERRLAELDAFRRHYTDDVTGLPNRSALRSYIDRENAEGAATLGALLMINVDRFRSTNDALGRSAGDRLLRAAGARIQSYAPNAYVARVENDTFAVLLRVGANADSLAARLHEAFRARFEVGDNDVAMTVSVGIAKVEPGEAADTVAYKAEVAVRSARGAGGDRTVTFSQELERLRNRRIGLDRDLQRAIERNELSLNYQPIIGAPGDVVALEALLRWEHPTYGRVPPDEFIPLAEENGCIVSIGRWVLRMACVELARFRAASGLPLRVAVNVSARQFSDPDLLRAIEGALELGELSPDSLEIEITESTIASDPVQATRILAEMRLAGITVSVDDFGTGYSSLANLRRFPLDNLKIDRSFVAKTPQDVEDCAIVEAIIGLARQLSLNVIAEGVETPDQADYLIGRGCEMLQGYYFAKPLAAEDVVGYVCENWSRRGARRRA